MIEDFRENAMLSVAGTDPLLGAGCGADVRVFETFGFVGTAVETAFVAQNSLGVQRFLPSDPAIFLERLRLVNEDCRVAGLKIGMTSSPDILGALKELLPQWSASIPVVFDPVLASGGPTEHALHQGELEALVVELLPYITLFTPNARELQAFTGRPVETVAEAIEGARELHRKGAAAVLIKGGHLQERGRDFLSYASGEVVPVYRGKEWGVDIHGTGCHLSSAIACLLAQGASVFDACRQGTEWLHTLVAKKAYYSVGRGRVQFDPSRLAEGFSAV